MKSIFSDQLSDFSNIHLDDVEVISIARPNFNILEDSSFKFLQTRQSLKLQWMQDVEDDNCIESTLTESVPPTLKSLLVNQVDESSKMLSDLLGCNKVSVRLASLRSPMCPLFHVDNIACRLLITLCGKGTEWIPNDSVDWKILSDRKNNSLPVKDESAIMEFKVGHWSLLKGGAWSNNFNGVVHRSPDTSDARLLLSLDPVFE
tara:strand:- start:365 stop:976 length:612 start_codon:yes stop_codon:yes gene_type:complete